MGGLARLVRGSKSRRRRLGRQQAAGRLSLENQEIWPSQRGLDFRDVGRPLHPLRAST